MTRDVSDTDRIVLDAISNCTSDAKAGVLLEQAALGANTAMRDLNVPSLERFEAMMMIEEALDIELDDDEVTTHETLFDFLDFISERVAEARTNQS